MKELKITESDYGKEFLEALENVLEIRKKKRIVYGDAFMCDDMLFLKYQIENKIKRFNAQIISGELIDTNENSETAKDSCIDIVNYSLFLIAKMNRGDRK